MEHPGEPDPAGDSPVLALECLGQGMLAKVGGKAANLGELARAGLPVPAGFCLTTLAYLDATASPALADVHRALAATAPDDLAGLASLAAKARELVLDADVPAGIDAAVRAAYAALGADRAVAVRSSATAEDLPFASFAGQQDTFLNVVGADAVLAAVRRCWASLWTDRAVTYRAVQGIEPSAVSLAVVVQRMVDAAVAGVLFTANPVTGRRHEAVIDASPGLGEAVVSGAVNPDHFVLDGATGRILERRLGDKGMIIRPLPGGGTERVAQPGAGLAPSLDDAQLAALELLGRRAEVHFGSPQDLEWAIGQDGAVWLTQSRPITTLYPMPERPPSGPAPRVYLCFSLAQGLTRPLTPMGLAGIRLIASSVAGAAHFPVPVPREGPAPYAEAGQRIFFDLTPVVRSKAGRAIVPRVFDVMEARSAAVLRNLFADPRFSVTVRSPWRLLRHIVPVAARARVPETLIRGLIRPEEALRRADHVGEQLRVALAVPAGATATQRLDHVERILGRDVFAVVPAILPLPALGFALLAVAGKLAGDPGNGALQEVLRGLPNNVTTEMDLDLWSLATVIRNDPASAAVFGDPLPEIARRYRAADLPGVVQSGLSDFLGRYGQRAVAEIDVGMPRWSDDPTHILGVLANYLRVDDPALAPDRQFGRAAREAEAQVGRLVAAAGQRSRLRGALARAALRRTRMFAGLRELPKYYLVEAFGAVRQQLAAVGAELAAAGTLDAAEDIFFVDLAEAHRGVGGEALQGVVAQRREAYAAELGRRHIPRVLLSDGTEPEAVQIKAGQTGAVQTGAGGRGPAGADGSAGQLSGTPASAGTVTARARVILNPQGAHLEPGEILVAPSTDPGWTPLFLTAGGLVMEMGGPNSHGAVVAREYGIPAVVGVPDATARIATGDNVTVDGAAGTVMPAR
ncbi:PEP/pyruvate-binding domain-containing protein [Arthrobacter sp. ok362]|uniref:PEP/pyruvate-binding domain-containing protein n=1 Tax=Arthrobacter sp. ok362 TaxID=1761745 RepID=UPI00088D3B94|nr:PEP/pyruvate-binding domain-containing protein [Arthrobacter sp. ok362]SDL41883.1 pyruvate, water dikinase [Arthrobacter sp. ok362]